MLEVEQPSASMARDPEAAAPPPRVSVIITVYNDERRLPRAVRSIIGQTFPDWEILIVDDGSTDRTIEVAAELAGEDSRIRVIAASHGGPGRGRNIGIEEARGEWVAILDADDYAEPDRLTRQLDFAARYPSVGLVGAHAYRVSTNGRTWGVWTAGPRTLEEFRAKRDAGELIYFIHSSILARRSLLLAAGGYPEDYPSGEDTALYNLRLAPLTEMLTLPEPLVHHEMDPRSAGRRAYRGVVTDLTVIRHNLERRRQGLPEAGWDAAVAELVGDLSLIQRLVARRRILSTAWQLQGAAQVAGGSPYGFLRLAAAGILAPEVAAQYVRRIRRSARR